MAASTDAILPWRHSAATVPQGQRSPAPAAINTNKPGSAQSAHPERGGFKPFGDDGFSFLDLIDVINPLHHIPLIGPLYRDFTGDTIDPLPRIAGSTLFLGPIGAGMSTADVLLEETTGKDAGAHVLAFMRDSGTTTRTIVADTAPASAPAAAGTDGEDPVSAWARREHAYRTGLTAHSPTGSAAATAALSRNAIPASANTPLAAPELSPKTQPLPPAVADTDGEDPVSAWARAETAYRTALVTPSAGQATLALKHQPRAPIPPATRPATKLAAPTQISTPLSGGETRAASIDRQRHAAQAVKLYRSAQGQAARQMTPRPVPGSVAPAGGWFAEAMNGNLQRYRQMAIATPKATSGRALDVN